MITRWSVTAMRSVYAAVALLLLVASAPVRADAVPGMAASPDRHLSFDTSPVTVRFLYNDGTRDLQIPRKYIVFASGDYSSLDGPIPDLIETQGVKLVLAYPDGEAWSVAIREYVQEHGVGPLDAAAGMRNRMHIVELMPANRTFTLDAVRQDSRIRNVEGFMGEHNLLEFSISNGSETLFVADEEDEFLRAICKTPRNKSWFCKYTAHLTPNLGFSADFVDLRLYGGRDFANDRIRMIKRTLCSFTESC